MRDLSLLTTKVIPVLRKDGTHDALTLPETLAALSDDDVQSFREIKVHQAAAIDLFFAHLGVVLIDLAKDDLGFKADASVWNERLLSIAPESAWKLYSEDPTVSSFMQPGMSRKEFEKTVANKGKTFSPDEIGVLIVSKNHTNKFSAMVEPSAWHWIASLIETQTLSGFDGSSLYGIPRMNGGLSTRFRVATYTDLSASGKWNSDVRKVLDALPDIYHDYPHFHKSGKRIAATWALEWDGKEQIKTTDLHPLYVDVCRRLKLGREPDGRLFVVTAGSSGTRIPSLDLKGNFGDPWAPRYNTAFKVDKKGNVKDSAPAYSSLSPNAISVGLLAKIVTGDQGYERSRLQAFVKSDIGKPAFFCLSGILRGQGETYGYHDVVIPIPAAATFRFASRSALDELGSRSRSMLELADKAEQVLKIGVYRFCQPENVDIDFKNSEKSTATFARTSDRFKQAFSAEFFGHLWNAAESGTDEAWIAFLKETAERALEAAFLSGSSRTQLSFKAEAQGRSAFGARWYNVFSKKEDAA